MSLSHKVTEQQYKHSSDGNLNSTTPVCSCGWIGGAVEDYNDDQAARIRKQIEQHLNQPKCNTERVNYERMD